jgi:hypothetical protein
MSEGFYKRRRGILEHIEAGTIDLLESGIHDFLSLKANLLIGSPCSIPVGVVFTSAPAIHPYYRRVSERTIQRCLEHLEAIGWLKLFNTQGKRGNYPVLVCRASVHDMSGNEYRINGTKTTDWRKPVFEPVGDVSVSCPESVGGVSGYRELREESREKREHQNPASVPHSNSLELETQAAAFEVFWDKWPLKQAKTAARRSWMKVPIGEYPDLMSGLEKWLVSDQWKRGVIPHPATWLTQKRWQDEDIPQFVGGSNGNAKKLTGDALTAANLRAAGYPVQ